MGDSEHNPDYMHPEQTQYYNDGRSGREFVD